MFVLFSPTPPPAVFIAKRRVASNRGGLDTGACRLLLIKGLDFNTQVRNPWYNTSWDLCAHILKRNGRIFKVQLGNFANELGNNITCVTAVGLFVLIVGA